jgi:serine/threonine-protein kinase HipA
VTTLAEVKLWGRRIGAVALEDGSEVASFQYDNEFATSGIEVAPIVMPLSNRVYRFPQLPVVSFHGLPGLLSDSLPDRFGNALIDAWLATQGRQAASFNAVERLCYTGARGMGALEFAPVNGPQARITKKLNIDALVQLASDVLAHQGELKGSFVAAGRTNAVNDILQVGTSAGGARAKAIIAWNPTTNEVRSGQVIAPPGFGYWLLKFDGVSGNKDKELQDTDAYTVIEYAYSLMAKEAGIEMTECRMLEENNRRHFMTRRFDRLENGGKLHAQSLAALAHFDFNNAAAYSYEQAFEVIKQLELPMHAREQQFRRMAFNVVARNQDDHVKNIAFLMNKEGEWSLASAFDITYNYNASGVWTARHQMSVNNQRDSFSIDDFRACAQVAGLKRGRGEKLLNEVTTAVAAWKICAAKAGVPSKWRAEIQSNLRLKIK